MTISHVRPAALLLAAVALTIAGCAANPTGSGAPASGVPAGSATATGSYPDQVMAWGRRFAACARSHGIPDFPDPVYPADARPSGPLWGFALFATADKAALGQVVNGACADVARQMPPAPDANRPPGATTLAQMRKYAQCMRLQGMSDFPDPKADGTFPILNTRYAGLSNLSPEHPSQALGDADHACRQYQTDWDIQAS